MRYRRLTAWRRKRARYRPRPRAGKIRRVTGRRVLYKLKDFKKVYVRIEDDSTKIALPASDVLPAVDDAKAQLR